MITVTINITKTINDEYTARMPEFLPLDKLTTGKCVLTLEEAQAVLDDAKYNSDLDAVCVGKYYMPVSTFKAYKALAKQTKDAIEKAING